MLLTPPLLVTPTENEPMLLYIAATNQVVSTALVVERAEEGKIHGVQRPVYYLSEVLSRQSSGTRTIRRLLMEFTSQLESYGIIS